MKILMWVWLGMMSSTLLACSSAGSAPPRTATESASGGEASPSEGSLATRVLQRMRKLAPQTPAKIVNARHIRVGAHYEQDVYLDNLEKACGYAPSSCEERIDTFARVAVAPPDARATLDALMPTLKSSAFIDEVRTVSAQHGQRQELVALPLVDELRVVLVIDTPNATRFVSDRDLATLGLTAAQAEDRALSNLSQRSPTLPISEVRPGLYALSANDGFDSARFLLHGQWQPLVAQLGGAPVVVPIGRDLVLFTTDTSAVGLETLALIIASERQQPAAAYPITTRAYRWTARGWEGFELPALR